MLPNHGNGHIMNLIVVYLSRLLVVTPSLTLTLTLTLTQAASRDSELTLSVYDHSYGEILTDEVSTCSYWMLQT